MLHRGAKTVVADDDDDDDDDDAADDDDVADDDDDDDDDESISVTKQTIALIQWAPTSMVEHKKLLFEYIVGASVRVLHTE